MCKSASGFYYIAMSIVRLALLLLVFLRLILRPRGCAHYVGHQPCISHTRGADFSVLDISTAGIVSGAKNLGVWKHLLESFPETSRRWAPSCLSSNRAWKTIPGGCGVLVHRRVRYIFRGTGVPNQVGLVILGYMPGYSWSVYPTIHTRKVRSAGHALIKRTYEKPG